VIANGGKLRTRASYDLREGKNSHIVQTDFITVLDSGEEIVESFAGVGDDLNAAVKDSLAAYQDCTFHALSSALLGMPCDHAEVEEWEIGATRRKMTFGLLRMRGKLPEGSWPPIMEGIEKPIKASGLSGDLHWVRYFYAHIPGEEPTVEVLLDDDDWTPVQEKAKSLPWPESDDYYSARLFFVIQDQPKDAAGSAK
jgi:hypothetical protein